MNSKNRNKIEQKKQIIFAKKEYNLTFKEKRKLFIKLSIERRKNEFD